MGVLPKHLPDVRNDIAGGLDIDRVESMPPATLEIHSGSQGHDGG